MLSSRSILCIAISTATAGLGCASAPGATAQQLQTRAVFDLGCPHHQLMLYHLDGRTKAVAGCGRRLVYVESCQKIRGHHQCTWVLDTPTFAQASWPDWQRQRSAPTYVGVHPSPNARSRPVATELFDPRAAPAPAPQPPPPPSSPPAVTAPSQPATVTAPSQPTAVTSPPGTTRRAHPTDLFETKAPDKPTTQGRTFPTELFDPSDL